MAASAAMAAAMPTRAAKARSLGCPAATRLVAPHFLSTATMRDRILQSRAQTQLRGRPPRPDRASGLGPARASYPPERSVVLAGARPVPSRGRLVDSLRRPDGRRRQHVLLVLVPFLALTVLYNLATPVFEAGDEQVHF